MYLIPTPSGRSFSCLRLTPFANAFTKFAVTFAAKFAGSVGAPVLVEKLNAAKALEGAALGEDLRSSMQKLRAFGEEMAELRNGVREAQFERLRTRLVELTQGVSVNEERVLTEASVLAEKSDIEEEIVRLRTHVDRFVALLDEGGELGKRLDFLLQELNREANTMLSKTSGATGENSLRITELGLEMKAVIEKAREQVQNIE